MEKKNKYCLECGNRLKGKQKNYCKKECKKKYKEDKNKTFYQKITNSFKKIGVVIVIFVVLSALYKLLSLLVGLSKQSLEAKFLVGSIPIAFPIVFLLYFLVGTLFIEVIKYMLVNYIGGWWCCFNKFNKFVIFSVLLIILIFFVGFDLLQSSFPSNIPLSPYLFTNEGDINYFSMVCSSWKGYYTFVKGDIITCNTTLDFGDNLTYKGADVFYRNYNTPSLVENLGKIYLYDKNSKKSFVNIPLSNTSFNTVDIYFYFEEKINEQINETGSHLGYTFSYDLIEQKEYIEREYKKYSLLILLVTLSIYTIFVGINNLKNMIEVP